MPFHLIVVLGQFLVLRLLARQRTVGTQSLQFGLRQISFALVALFVQLFHAGQVAILDLLAGPAAPGSTAPRSCTLI